MSHDQLRRPQADEFDAIVNNDTKVNKKRRMSIKTRAGIALGALIVGGGGGYAANTLMSNDSETTRDIPELVTGPNGEPLTLVPYSEEHLDRNNDGFDDGFTDVNENNVNDNKEDWNQTTNEFVDPRSGENETALENATPEDLANINEIRSTYPQIDDNEYWVSEFIGLDEQVKQYAMVVLRNPDRYANEQEWQIAFASSFSVTSEELDSL